MSVPHAQPRFADWFGSHDEQGQCIGMRLSPDGKVIDKQCGRWRGEPLVQAEPVDYRRLPEDAPLRIPRASAAELSGGKRQLLYPSSDCYIGAVGADGLAEGPGVMHYDDDGSKLTGTWQQGMLQGPGSALLDSGDRYEGGFKDNLFDGRGRYTWKGTGAVYEGGFNAGKKHGHGVKWGKDGKAIYRGRWENDAFKEQCPVPLSALPADTKRVPDVVIRQLARAPAGREVFVTLFGRFRVCSARVGEPGDGDGVEFDAAGVMMARGRWTGKVFTGLMRKTLDKGDTLVCEWEVDRQHGFFLRWNKDGMLLKHGFKFDDGVEMQCAVPRSAVLSFDALPADVKRAVALEGQGALCLEGDGNMRAAGILKNGQASNPGFRVYSDGRLVSGAACSGAGLVDGRVVYPSKDEYRGQLRDGLPHGVGIMRLKVDGTKHAGRFARGKLELGVELDSNGNVKRKGRWDNEGVYHEASVPVSVLNLLPSEIKRKLHISQKQGSRETALLFPPGHPHGAHSYAGQLNRAHQPHGRGSMRDAAGRPIQGQCGEWQQGKLKRPFFALLIGNDAYPGPDKLSGCVRDVERLQRILERLSFHVTILRDGTETQMEAAIKKFAAALQLGCVAWIHYSGHGDSTAGQREYMVPVDLDDVQLDSSSSLCHINIMGALAERGGKEALYMLTPDSCRGSKEMAPSDMDCTSSDDEENDAPTTGRKRKRPLTRDFQRILRQKRDHALRCQFITGSACAPEHVAFETRSTYDAHGVYTRALCDELEALQPGAHSGISDVFKRVTQRCNTHPGRKQTAEFKSTLGKDVDWQLLMPVQSER